MPSPEMKLQNAPILLVPIIALVLGLASCERRNTTSVEQVQEIVSAEEMILELTNRLKPLNRAARNLAIPSGEAQLLFDDDCRVVGVDSVERTEDVTPYLTQHVWSIAPAQELSADGIWAPFLSTVDYFETAKFYLIDGVFNEDGTRFNANLGFAAHTRSVDGDVGAVTGKVQTVWAWADPENSRLHIVEWTTKSLESTHSDQRLFRDVTSLQITDTPLVDQLATSVHQDINRMLMKGREISMRGADTYPFFFAEVTLEHPSVAVVDLNGDGADDFFFGRPHEPALFFMNDGRGNFREVAQQIGLTFDSDCTAALFADYDNDGDQDLFVGRARHRSVYMENVEGKFRDATEERVGIDLPYLVSSICAADYNRDGLLDVYFSTYSPNEGQLGVSNAMASLWPEVFLTQEQQDEFDRRRAKGHPFLKSAGPPNVLLENTGDGFARSQHDEAVQSWRKSFQSTWSDYDADGDPDLYVCNDFGPDDLYRNDGDAFIRVNDEVGLDTLGFGMGVTWGDHNNDGTLDLYVSNMFSKAGSRITAQIEDLNPDFRQMAMGNFLFEVNDGRFELVSLGGSQDAVSKAGWSWGGQFTDIDNDGWLDLCVASGYYSAPPELALEVDL